MLASERPRGRVRAPIGMTPDDESARASGPDQEPAPLPDDAVVVRFGLSSPETLRKTALAHHDEHGDLAISVFSLPGRSSEELARLGGLLHSRIRETTVGAIRSPGYDVVRDEPPEGHALITLPRLPTDEDYMRIAETFGPSLPNPVIAEGADGA